MTREEAEKEVEKLGLTGQAKAQKINELMEKKASNFEGGTAKEGKSEKQIKAEKKAAQDEAMREWMTNRPDVQNAIRRSQIANPSVGVIDRIAGNVTGLNEDLFDPTAIKAKDLDETGNLKAKDFHLGGDIEGNFIGAEEEAKRKGKGGMSEKVSAYSGTSNGISDYDKKHLDTQSGRSNYQADKELDKWRETEKDRYDALANDFKLAQEGFRNIEDKYIKELPTFMYRRYKNGEFGEPESKDAKLRLAHFMVNGLGTMLGNASNVIKGKALEDSDYEKYQKSNLEQGLANRWMKNNAETESAIEALKKQGIEEQDIRNSINKISTNANMQTAFNMMNEEQKVHALKVISEIGDVIKDFNNDELATFLTGAMLSNKDFSNEDLLTAVGLKFGTDFIDSETGQNIINKIKSLAK